MDDFPSIVPSLVSVTSPMPDGSAPLFPKHLQNKQRLRPKISRKCLCGKDMKNVNVTYKGYEDGWFSFLENESHDEISEGLL